MKTALLLVDVQNDYFPGGNMELDGAHQAGLAASRLLSEARERSIPVIHVQHLSVRPGATFFIPGTSGAEINTSMKPLAGETVISKNFPNSFRQTGLNDLLESLGVERLVIAGMMSHMCIDATTRAAFDLGYQCLVAQDACATRTLAWREAEIPATQVHGAFMAGLAAVYAQVLDVDDILALWADGQ